LGGGGAAPTASTRSTASSVPAADSTEAPCHTRPFFAVKRMSMAVRPSLLSKQRRTSAGPISVSDGTGSAAPHCPVSAGSPTGLT